jgi:hypothetical protein
MMLNRADSANRAESQSLGKSRGPASEGPATPGSDPNAGGGGSGDPNAAIQPGAAPSESKFHKSEEEDFSTSPFTSYGEFNENEEEEADSKFFQYGRFFGASLGLGAEMVDGNRGALWQGGFPMVDFKLHYWFDFNLALDLGFFTAQHYFNTTAAGYGYTNVNLFHIGVDVKYYFDTKNLSSAISFASPYIIAGAGSYSITENTQAQSSQNNYTSVGICLGVGLEFVISPRKSYFELEGKGHFVTFQDTYTSVFSSVGIPNLTGNFYTVSGSILFTW